MYLPVTNGTLESAPTFVAATTGSGVWIDGTAAGSASASSGWSNLASAVSAQSSAQFDTSVSHSGSNSLLLATQNTAGAITCGNILSTASPLAGGAVAIVGNKSYILTCWCKTSTVATNSAFIDFRRYNSSGTNLGTTSSSKLSGTNDWTKLSITLTAEATAAWAVIFLRNNVTGNVGSAWFDDITLTGPDGNMLQLF